MRYGDGDLKSIGVGQLAVKRLRLAEGAEVFIQGCKWSQYYCDLIITAALLMTK